MAIAPAKLLLSCLILISPSAIVAGCSPPVKEGKQEYYALAQRQIEFTRVLIDNHFPENNRRKTSTLVKKHGFDFLLNAKVDDVTGLAEVMSSFDGGWFNSSKDFQQWRSNLEPDVELFELRTNLWEIDGSDGVTLDLLILVVKQRVIIEWRMLPMMPY